MCYFPPKLGVGQALRRELSRREWLLGKFTFDLQKDLANLSSLTLCVLGRGCEVGIGTGSGPNPVMGMWQRRTMAGRRPSSSRDSNASLLDGACSV